MTGKKANRKKLENDSKDRRIRQKQLNLWVNKWTQKRNKNVCKPCWEINYCPYGPLVEDFPFVPITRKQAVERNEFLIQRISGGDYDTDPVKKREFQQEVREFDPRQYPIAISKSINEKACSVFGHLCPVFFVSEPFTETGKIRQISRHISRGVMFRVVRRDNSTCQVCGIHLLDNEIQFDHIIPISKGGPSNESNLRTICSDCNLMKSNNLDFEELNKM